MFLFSWCVHLSVGHQLHGANGWQLPVIVVLLTKLTGSTWSGLCEYTGRVQETEHIPLWFLFTATRDLGRQLFPTKEHRLDTHFLHLCKTPASSIHFLWNEPSPFLSCSHISLIILAYNWNWNRAFLSSPGGSSTLSSCLENVFYDSKCLVQG